MSSSTLDLVLPLVGRGSTCKVLINYISAVMPVNKNCVLLLIEKHQQIGQNFNKRYSQITNCTVIIKKILVPICGQNAVNFISMF